MDKNKLGTMMQSAAKVPIRELNECITCKLCRGYFIDATTIIECLHTFCRSCIVRYLESNKYCPICDVQVHKTKPLLNLRPDKTIQDLVYKLVPRLYQSEIQRRKVFYETHPEGKPTSAEETAASQYDYILAPEESVNLTLNYHGCSTAPRYLRCPSAVLVTHLKKLIRAKYELTEHHRVDMFYNQDCLNPSYSLMDISYIYSWKRKDPLDLTYKIYESRAKKPKLETTDTSENVVNNSTNNNNNNWKEVQLRISENGEMSITGIEDSSMLELLDATENFKSEIVINEGKNLENFPKPIQVDTEIGNSEVKIQANHSIRIDNHGKACENAPKQQENAQKPLENNVAIPKKELPGLKFIGKTSASSCTTSTLTSTKSASVGTKTSNSSTKTGNSISKLANNANKTNVDARKAPNVPFSTTTTNTTEAVSNAKTSNLTSNTKASSTKPIKTSLDHKVPKNAMPKSMELSASLNLNSELSVIPLNASTSCVSLTSCGVTTTVFSTINKSMCSTRMESVDSQKSGTSQEQSEELVVNSKKGHTENEKETVVNSVSRETKNLKRKCEEDGKTPEVPAKLPKPKILNHSIGLMNLSNNHPLKKHSKINRNGEHLLRTPEISEKVPISTPTLTVNHVSVPQKHISMANTPSKPIIINKNVSNLQINRPGTPKCAQRGSQGGNVPCYANKTMLNSVGGKLLERNGEKLEGMQGKTEILNASVNSIPKTSILHPIHNTPSYQTSHHTPIITPSQLPHHQSLNSLQLKPPACSNSTHSQEKIDQKMSQLTTPQSNAATSQSNTVASQGSIATSQSNLASLKTSMATSHSSLTTPQNIPVTTQSNTSGYSQTSQTRSDVTQFESSQPSNKPSVQTTPHSTAPNHSIHASALSTAQSLVPNTPLSQTPPTSIVMTTSPAPMSIKTKPSTPIGYKTLRDPPKSWNSQINSQIARVNQNVKAQQLANAVAAASQGGGVNAQGRFSGDLKSVRPAKFFKGRNMPRYLGCPASGVKPMYQVQPSSEKDKNQDQQTTQAAKSEKSEIKKHSIVKIDPKTLRPISEKAPETSNLSNISSSLGINTSQNNQELHCMRLNATSGDLKINTSSVSIFNPLKLQSSPKSERKSPKSPHSPKVKGSPNSSSASAITTSPPSNSPASSTTLSPKQHRDKTNLTFTPPNPFVPNLASPTLSPNQFLYPAGGFPSYDPRVMAAYHSLWYTQRMAAAAAAGFVPPPMPHAFGMNMGLNAATTTIGQQQHSPGISSKHSTPPKISSQTSPRGSNATAAQLSKSSPTPPNKKTKESPAKNEKSLETALNKLSQNKAKELSENKTPGGTKQLGGGKKAVGNKDLAGGNGNDAQRSATPKVSGGNNNNSFGDSRQRISSSKVLGENKKTGGHKESVRSNLTLINPQQSRTSPNDSVRNNSTMTALEKLSHNKAIEILGGNVSGKKSPIVHEKDGRNSPMAGNNLVFGSFQLLASQDTTKRQSSSTKDSLKTVSEITKPSSQKMSPQRHHIQATSPEKSNESNMEGEKTAQISPISEPKTVSSELQTRLGQCPEASNDRNCPDKSEKTEEQGQNMSDLDQIKSDQSENRLEQDQNTFDQNQGELRTSHSPPVENKLKNMQDCDGECKSEQKDASNGPKVTSSDKTENSDEKHSTHDSSDIKPSRSENSRDASQNPSANDTTKPSSTCGNAVTDQSGSTSAGSMTTSRVTGGESEVQGTPGDNATSKDAAGDVAADKSGNGADKSGDVTESDKGGGEKK